nr:imelysin family protein [uncultured Cohaesibacter sp.]
MWKYCLILYSLLLAPALADDQDLSAIIPEVINQHILPGYQRLAKTTSKLSDVVGNSCPADIDAVKRAYNEAFDAWMLVSHLRFGPSEEKDRAFALAFWPDTRGFTPKTLAGLLSDNDPAIHNAEKFKGVSIAARGFYPMEFLLYGKQFADKSAPNLCALMDVMAKDIASNSAAILSDWQKGYAELMIAADNDIYRDPEEAVRQLYTALTTGLQFTAQTRLGRPMGTFAKPRPNRAEARRSARSLRHVQLSLQANRQLAALLSGHDEDIDKGFERAIRIADELDDPAFANVGTVQGRIRVEALQGAITFTNDLLAEYLAPKLGITAGFNALDGD